MSLGRRSLSHEIARWVISGAVVPVDGGLATIGDVRESRAAYGRAIELAGYTAEDAYLTRRRDRLD